MSETEQRTIDQLHTLTLTEQQRHFFLARGCSVEEGELTAYIYCPPGTTKTYQNVEGIEITQGKGRLFLLAFPDGVTCQEWYFPTGESHLILPSETSDDILLTQSQIDALKEVLRYFVYAPSESPAFPVLESSLLDCYHSLLTRFERISPSSTHDILSIPMREQEFMLLYVGLATLIAPYSVGLPIEEPLQDILKRLLPVYQHIKPVADLLQAASFERFDLQRKTPLDR